MLRRLREWFDRACCWIGLHEWGKVQMGQGVVIFLCRCCGRISV